MNIEKYIDTKLSREFKGLDKAQQYFRNAYGFIATNYTMLGHRPGDLQQVYKRILNVAWRLNNKFYDTDSDNSLYHCIDINQTINLDADARYEFSEEKFSPVITKLSILNLNPRADIKHLRGKTPRHGYFVYDPNVNAVSPLAPSDILTVLHKLISDVKDPLKTIDTRNLLSATAKDILESKQFFDYRQQSDRDRKAEYNKD